MNGQGLTELLSELLGNDIAKILMSILTFAVMLVLAIVNHKLNKKNNQQVLTIETKTAEGKAQTEEIVEIKKENQEIRGYIEVLANMVSAAFLDSKASVETKKYIESQVALLPKGEELIKQATEIIPETIAVAKESYETIKKNTQESVEQAKGIAKNTMDIYNKIIKKEA